MTYALKPSILSLALAGSVLAIWGLSAGPALSDAAHPVSPTTTTSWLGSAGFCRWMTSSTPAGR